MAILKVKRENVTGLLVGNSRADRALSQGPKVALIPCRFPAHPLLNLCPCTSTGCLAEAWFGGQGAKQRGFPLNTPHTPDNGTIKDPAEWTTSDEPMTGAQDSFLHTLARKASEHIADDMTKAEASMKIDELRQKTGVDKVKRKRIASNKAAK
jgi:hypothetical protein